jgi:hypothetical protein
VHPRLLFSLAKFWKCVWAFAGNQLICVRMRKWASDDYDEEPYARSQLEKSLRNQNKHESREFDGRVEFPGHWVPKPKQ